VQPRRDGDVGVYDGAGFEHFIDERIFVWRGRAAAELFLEQRLFLQRVLVEQL